MIATKDKDGKVKLHQIHSTVKAGAVSGGFWGALIGLIFLNPLLGMAIGAAGGAASRALTDVGINDQFMKELAENLKPNSSALFVLVRKANPERVLEELKGTGGKILKTSLSHEDEAKLQAALDAAQQEAALTTTDLKLRMGLGIGDKCYTICGKIVTWETHNLDPYPGWIPWPHPEP